MGISLAPELEPAVDPLKPKPAPTAPAAGPALNSPAAPIGLAPAPQTPGSAGAAPPLAAPVSAIPPSAYGNAPSTVPAPTVAAPSAPVDRVKLATETFGNLAATRQAQYAADSRDNVHNSAALGQVASGGLRTREGNLQLARERDLDTLQKDLTLKATEGSIADAQTAYGQALAGSQQGLAEKIGLAGIDTSRGSLDLEKEKFGVGSAQTQEQIDLAKRAQEQNFGLETEKVGLAKEGQAATIEQQKAALALQEKLGLGGLDAEQQRIAIAKKQQEIEAAYQAKQIDLATRNQTLAELAQAQQNASQNRAQTLAEKAQAEGQANEQQRIGLAKEQLAAEGERFGLSLAQQKELATIADKTANRQLDISSAQGKNSLLLELARIMGAKDLSSIDPKFLEAVAKSLGVALPTNGTTTTTAAPTTPTGTTGTHPGATGTTSTRTV